MQIRTFALIGPILAASALGGAAVADSGQGERLSAVVDPIVREGMADQHVPGVAVVVVQEGRTLFSKGYGVADLDDRRPVDPDETLFRVGSVSKALTGLAIAHQIDRGRLAYETDVALFTDGIENLSGSDEPVTIEHLLTHRGGFDQIGLDRQIGAFARPLSQRNAMRQSLRTFLESGHLRRVAPPGRSFTYDTYGITLAGLILEDVSGKPYAEAMRSELFEPLGMTRSFVEVDDRHRGDLAVGYGYADGDYVAQPYEVYVTTPASSIDATPADMGRLLATLTSAGTNDHGRFLSAEMIQAVLAPQSQPYPGFPDITHGFWEEYISSGEDEVRAVYHGGAMLGYSTLMMIVPDAKLGIAVFANRHPEAGGGPMRIDWNVAKAVIGELVDFYDLPPPPRFEPSNRERDDLTQYTGEYVHSLHCRSCSVEEFERGAWRASPSLSVSAEPNGLQVDDNLFVATDEPDLFVDPENTRSAVFFARADDGAIAYLTFSTAHGSFVRREEPSVEERK